MEHIDYFTILPLYFPNLNNLKKVENVEFEDGLLVRNDGSVDKKQTSYVTSSVIKIKHIETSTAQYNCYCFYNHSNFVASTYYAMICCYDESMKLLSAIPMNVNKGYIPLRFHKKVAYIRYSTNKANQELTNFYSTENYDLLSNIKSLNNDTNNLKNQFYHLLPGSLDECKWTKYECEWEPGLLRNGNNFDGLYTNYRISDYIKLHATTYNNLRFIYSVVGCVSVSQSFSVITFYDANKNYIGEIYGDNRGFSNEEILPKYNKNKKYMIEIPTNAVYARVCCEENQLNIAGLYWAQITNIENRIKNIEYNSESLVGNCVNLDKALPMTIYYNSRNDQKKRLNIDGISYNALGFVMCVIELSEEDEGKNLYVNCVPSIYSPGIRFYDERMEDDSYNENHLLATYFENTSSLGILTSGCVKVPKGARIAVLQGLFGNIYINNTSPLLTLEYLKQYISASFEKSTFKYDNIKNIEFYNKQKVLGINNNPHYGMFENFVDLDNLVGTYYHFIRLEGANKFINASDFSVLLIRDVQEVFRNNDNVITDDGLFLNIKSNFSQYVPAVVFFKEDIVPLDDIYTTPNTELENIYTQYYLTSYFLSPTTQGVPTTSNVQIKVPKGTRTIVVQCKHQSSDKTKIEKMLAASFTCAKFASKTDLVELKEEMKEIVEQKQKEVANYWTNKNIWWCGTSIPAAGYWSVFNTNCYPYLTGKILGAKMVYNEAVGSSAAQKSPANRAGTYEVISRRMGDTIQEKLDIFADCWTVDDSKQTVTAGPRKYAITSLPTVNTYADACTYRMQILSNCYEIKLIAKYLLKDKTEHDNFLKERFGNLYQTLIDLHPTAYTYQADIDLFVIDHSNNDGNAGSYTDINSLDIGHYVGALNTYVRWIQKYKTRNTIVFISNYRDAPVGVLKTEGDIAANWHMPYCELPKLIPIGGDKFKITTRGYWNSNNQWIEDGFTVDMEKKTTNCAYANLSSRVKGGGSFDNFISTSNVRQENGHWVWDVYPIDMWMRDGLHPHTDSSKRCLNVIAEAIAGFLRGVGDGRFL